jgi:hypothetical protein
MKPPDVPKITSGFILSSIKLITNWSYSPGMQKSYLYQDRAIRCDNLVNSILKTLPVDNPESAVWDNRRKK